MITRIRKMKIKKPSRKSVLFAFGLSIILFFAVLFPVGVLYAQSMDEMIPGDGKTGTIYNKYGASHYSFQTVTDERHFWQVTAKAQDGIVRAFDHLLSMFFLLTVQITRFFTFIAKESFTFSLMNEFIDAVEKIIQNITGIRKGAITSGGFWDSMGGMLVWITVLYILWLMLRTRFLDGLQQAISFVLALIICLAFFSNAGTFIKFINDVGSSVGNTMYVGLAKATGLSTDAQDGVTVISEQVWEELVIRPYAMLQFDDINMAASDPTLNTVLETKPFSPEREEALKQASVKYPAISRERSAEQFVVIILNLIFALVILGLFSYWAIFTLFMKFKTLTHAAVMSITLLASLLPGRNAGISVLRGQFVKLIGLVVMTVFAMFFLTLSLVLGHLAFKIVAVSAGKGWFLGMVFEAIVIFVVFKYRSEITSVFSKAAGVIPAMPRQKSTVVDAVQRNVTRSLYTSATNKINNAFNRKEPEGVPKSFNPSSLYKADSNLNDATNASMTLRYQREKQAAEEIAAESGESVQYTPFVQKVNDNLKNGTKNPFRGMDKEWKEEKGRLKDIKDDGGNVKQAILTQGVQEGMNDQEVAATIYGNENAIREASTFMVQRPKRAVDQIERAQSLNRNRKLQTSVNDFCMIQLFDRYKVDYKQAVDTSNMTGNPVQHTDFVKKMDERFKEAGLHTTQKVNDTMLVRSGRISIASHFEGMDEFKAYKMRLLKANEAFRKAAPPKEGVVLPGPQVRVTAPASTESIMKTMPKLPDSKISSRSLQQKSSMLLNVNQTMETKTKTNTNTRSDTNLNTNLNTKIVPNLNTRLNTSMVPKLDPKLNMQNVTFKNPELQARIKEAHSNLTKTIQPEDIQINVDTTQTQKVALNLKGKISTDVSDGLQDELKHLTTMNRSRQVAQVNKSNELISQNVQNKARLARQTQLKRKTNDQAD